MPFQHGAVDVGVVMDTIAKWAYDAATSYGTLVAILSILLGVAYSRARKSQRDLWAKEEAAHRVRMGNIDADHEHRISLLRGDEQRLRDNIDRLQDDMIGRIQRENAALKGRMDMVDAIQVKGAHPDEVEP